MHTKTFVWPSRHVEKSDDAISRVSSHNESYFSQYLTIKLYTVIRSKNLIQAFFIMVYPINEFVCYLKSYQLQCLISIKEQDVEVFLQMQGWEYLL